MIVIVSLTLALYEALAVLTHRTLVTEFSRRRWTGIAVWSWWILLGFHFARRGE